MGKTITLSPQELYFLGTVLDARYIDYDYISHMPDIQKRYSVHEQETMSQLADKGYVDEDFSGNVTVNDEIRELLEPVFFGEIEARQKKLENGLKNMLGIKAHVSLVAPKTIERSEGKAKRVIDNRKI